MPESKQHYEHGALGSLVDKVAAEISNVTANLARLQESNVKQTILPEWYADLVHHLAAEVELAFGRVLELEGSLVNLPTIAFHARSLYELWVWVRYCVSSEQNARRFYEDRYRDGLGLRNAFAALVDLFQALAPTEAHAALERLGHTLEMLSAREGTDALDDGYLRVGEAAEELGIAGAFQPMNRIFSKFAHPTAMTVLAPLQDEAWYAQRGIIFKGFGIGAALVGLTSISAFVQSRLPRVEGEDVNAAAR